MFGAIIKGAVVKRSVDVVTYKDKDKLATGQCTQKSNTASVSTVKVLYSSRKRQIPSSQPYGRVQTGGSGGLP